MMEKDFAKLQRKHAGTSRNTRDKPEETGRVLQAKNVLAHASSAKESIYELKRKEIEEYVSDFRHKGHHSLASEIEQSFRKVSDCLAEFEDSLCRYKTAFTSNQREKLEMDFKREMKRIQRQRDQIKQWLNDASIKDKTMMEEMKLIIETQMERYKTIERECKAREYSDYSLNISKKLTALEIEERKTETWLNKSIGSLQLRIDEEELKIDEIVNTKKRKSDWQQQQAIDDHKTGLERHKYHIGKLETVKRILINLANDEETLTSFLPKVASIKEDIEYYMVIDKEQPYEENEDLYTEIDDFERDWFDGKLKASATVNENSTAIIGTSPSLKGLTEVEESLSPVVQVPSPPLLPSPPPPPPSVQAKKEKETVQPTVTTSIPPPAPSRRKEDISKLAAKTELHTTNSKRFVPIRMLPKHTLKEYVPQKYLRPSPSPSTTEIAQNFPPQVLKSTTKFSNSTSTVTEPLLRKPHSPWTQRNYARKPSESDSSSENSPPESRARPLPNVTSSTPFSMPIDFSTLLKSNTSDQQDVVPITTTKYDRAPEPMLHVQAAESNSTNSNLSLRMKQSSSKDSGPRKTERNLLDRPESSSWTKVKSKRSQRPASKIEANSSTGINSANETEKVYSTDFIVRRARRPNKSFKIVGTRNSKTKTAKAKNAARSGWALKSISRSQLVRNPATPTRIPLPLASNIKFPNAPLVNSFGGWKISPKLHELCEDEKVGASSIAQERPLTTEEILFRLAFPQLSDVYKQKTQTHKSSADYSDKREGLINNTFGSSSLNSPRPKDNIGDGDKATMKDWFKMSQIRRGKRARYLATFFPKLVKKVQQAVKLPSIPHFPPLIEALESAVLISTKAAENYQLSKEYMGPPPPPPIDKDAFFNIPGLEGPPRNMYAIIEEELARFGSSFNCNCNCSLSSNHPKNGYISSEHIKQIQI